MSGTRAKGSLQKPDEQTNPRRPNHLSPEILDTKSRSPAGSRSSSPSSPKSSPFSDFFHFGKHKKKAETPESSEEVKEFNHEFFSDDALGTLYDEIKIPLKKYKIPENNDIERIQKYIAKLTKLKDQVITESRIKEETSKAFQWRGEQSEKLEVIEALKERQTIFIEKARRKMEKLEKVFLFDTQIDLYDLLKQIILSSQWEDALIKNNKAILKAAILDHDENETSVPVGIEKMMRILADMPAPKRRQYCGWFYYKPTPIFRSQVEKEEVLTQEIILQKIEKIREVANQQYIPEQQTSINDFYHKLKQLNPVQLSDMNALTVYMKHFAPLNPKIGSQSSDEGQEIVIDGMHAPPPSKPRGYGAIST